MRPPNFDKNPTALEPRLKEMRDRFKGQPNVIYFEKVAKRTMVKGPYIYVLEFPLAFVKAHQGKIGDRPIFQRPKSDREWPMVVSVKVFGLQTRYFVQGTDGWKDFVLDNNLRVGDLLIFSLISFSRFDVYIYPKEPVAIPVPIVHTDNDAIQRRAENEKEPADSTRNESRCQETSWCHLCGQRPPASPQFVETVNLPHMNVQAGFWLHARQVLRNHLIELQGPSKAVMQVEVWKYQQKGEVIYELESGWTEFVAANLLNIGDVLVFSMVGPWRFKVEVMDRN